MEWVGGETPMIKALQPIPHLTKANGVLHHVKVQAFVPGRRGESIVPAHAKGAPHRGELGKQLGHALELRLHPPVASVHRRGGLGTAVPEGCVDLLERSNAVDGHHRLRQIDVIGLQRLLEPQEAIAGQARRASGHVLGRGKM